MRQQSLYVYLLSLFLILFSLLAVYVHEPSSYTDLSGAGTVINRDSSDQSAGEGKVVKYEKRIRGLVPDKAYEIQVIKSTQQRELPFESAEFTMRSKKREVIFTFKKGDSLPTSANAPPIGKLYSYGQIVLNSPPEADSVSYSDLENTAITFSVEKKFIEYQGLTPKSIELNYLSGGSWQKIPLEHLPETSFTYMYRAQVPFGTYAVTYKQAVVEEEPAYTGPICGNKVVESGENCATCPSDVQCRFGETCQAGVCTQPPAPVRQAPPPIQAPPPRQVPQKSSGGSIFIWILIPLILIVVILIFVMLFKKPKEGDGEFDDFSQPAQPPGGQPIQPSTGMAQVQPPAQSTNQPVQQTRPTNNSVQTNVQKPQANQQIKNYINQVMNKGFEKEKVRSALISKGWPANTIDQAFKELGK